MKNKESKKLFLILGNQLFSIDHLDKNTNLFFMCEDFGLCTHYKYHKHKIIHFLSSMRSYRDLLVKKKLNVEYFELNKQTHFFKKLASVIKKHKINNLKCFEIEDKFFEQQLIDFAKENQLELNFIQSPMFLSSRENFGEYLNSTKKPFMKNFYKNQRIELKILIDKDNNPTGGKWSFDSDNRNKIPKAKEITPFVPSNIDDKNTVAVKKLVEKHFKEHPGSAENFWIPTTEKAAKEWLAKFLQEKIDEFGTYQDSIDSRCEFLFHSLISPMMNIGFLTPCYVVEECLNKKNSNNLNSIEGIIRQVIGWREFVRGIYQNFSVEQESLNFFSHKNLLTNHWYEGNTGVPPLDDSIKKANKWGYCHHIERLMILGNLMLLLEINPRECHRWFMEMFVDSSDWVMGPNVYGMSQFSDGGIFATKPYISGSNYILKMSNYKKGPWCDAFDGLYWSFIEKHAGFFSKNYRMRMMVSQVKKMDSEKKSRIYKAADTLRCKITTAYKSNSV